MRILKFNESVGDGIYSEIYNFCKVRNKGTIRHNSSEKTPRVNFILNILEKYNIDYEISEFNCDDLNTGFNIIMRGSSDKMVVAHHDIVNPNSDNANDNSASVINAIALKKIAPEINVVLLDGEEVGGLGSKYLSESINNGEFGKIDWVLNLELTGRGGDYFFIGNYPGKLFDLIKNKFNCPVVNTPFNDSVVFRRYNIDSVVINPLPPLEDGETSSVQYKDEYLNISMLFNCHSMNDSIDTIRVSDMKIFVEEVLLQIVR